MADTQRFSTPSGTDVEFVVDGGGRASGSLDDALSVLGSIAGAVTTRMQEIESGAPEETEIAFGLSPTPDGGLAVTRGGDSGHMRVVMRFTGDLGGMGQPPDEG
jgi:hypothetical protein